MSGPGDHTALRFVAQTEGAALCTLVGIEGSFSRRLGAQLAVGPDGRMAGDMADKCLDEELAKQAATGGRRVMRYGAGSPIVDFRLPCGSGLDVLVDPAPDRMAVQVCVAALDRREATELDLPLPDGAGAHLLTTRHYIPAPRLLLFGSGAELRAVERLATAFGLAVEVHEPGALALGRAPQGIAADAWTAVLLLFHDHEWEHALLDWALSTPAFYIGAQGGAPAREARLERLAAAGHGKGELARVRGPVGLIPRARDADVLALSVLAEVVAAYDALHPHG